VKYVAKEFYRDRERYADRLYCSEDTFAVADGMGIGKGGKVAAEKAIELVDRHRPFMSLGDVHLFFQRANREIMEETARLGDQHIAGTTLSLISILNGAYILGHVGDSRIYLWRDGWLELLTTDQIKHKGDKKYVSALGIEWKPDVVLREGEVKKGDIFLIISDGAVNIFSDSELELIINPDIERSAEKLLGRYLETTPREDLSFIIVRVD